jgi:DnaK suppressor protein
MDLATRQSEQAYLLRLADKEQKKLQEIDRALAKFERGEYGYCEGTGEPIGMKRLALRPWARHGIEFKERLERERGGRAKPGQ